MNHKQKTELLEKIAMLLQGCSIDDCIVIVTALADTVVCQACGAAAGKRTARGVMDAMIRECVQHQQAKAKRNARFN